MMYTLFMEIYVLPKNFLNSRAHWAVRNAHNRKWDEIVYFWSAGNRPKKPLKTAHVKLTRYSARRMDFDNLVASFKSVVDSLVTNEILEDDNWDVIGMPEFHWFKERDKKKQKITVEVTGYECETAGEQGKQDPRTHAEKKGRGKNLHQRG